MKNLGSSITNLVTFIYIYSEVIPTKRTRSPQWGRNRCFEIDTNCLEKKIIFLQPAVYCKFARGVREILKTQSFVWPSYDCVEIIVSLNISRSRLEALIFCAQNALVWLQNYLSCMDPSYDVILFVRIAHVALEACVNNLTPRKQLVRCFVLSARIKYLNLKHLHKDWFHPIPFYSFPSTFYFRYV